MNIIFGLLVVVAIAFQASTANPAYEPLFGILQNLTGNVVGGVETTLTNFGQTASETITNAISSASEFVFESGTSDLDAISNDVTNALSQLNGLKDAATTAINNTKNRAGAFTNILTVLGQLVRVLLTDLTNVLNALITSANNTATQIQNGADGVAGQITAAIADSKIDQLYANLTIAIESESEQAKACADTLIDAIVNSANQTANALATCNENAQKSLNSAISTVINGIADQFKIVSDATAAINQCLQTAIQTNVISFQCGKSILAFPQLGLTVPSQISLIAMNFASQTVLIASSAAACAISVSGPARIQVENFTSAFQECLDA